MEKNTLPEVIAKPISNLRFQLFFRRLVCKQKTCRGWVQGFVKTAWSTGGGGGYKKRARDPLALGVSRADFYVFIMHWCQWDRSKSSRGRNRATKTLRHADSLFAIWRGPRDTVCRSSASCSFFIRCRGLRRLPSQTPNSTNFR